MSSSRTKNQELRTRGRDFFSRHPPITVLEENQQKMGLKKVFRPTDLAIRNHLTRLGFSRAKKILDFGCGNGVWLERLLAERKASGVGVDIAEKLIEEAKARPGKRGQYFCNKNHWPLKENDFDFCLSFDVFEHIKDKKFFVSRLFKAMRPGARFLFYTLNPNNKYTFDWLFEKLGSDYPYRRADHKKSLYIHPQNFELLLKRQGFKNINWVLYDGPANQFWNTFCLLNFCFLERFFSLFHLKKLIKPALYLNDFWVKLSFPLNSLIDSFFFARGYSNGYFIWGEK